MDLWVLFGVVGADFQGVRPWEQEYEVYKMSPPSDHTSCVVRGLQILIPFGGPGPFQPPLSISWFMDSKGRQRDLPHKKWCIQYDMIHSAKPFISGYIFLDGWDEAMKFQVL